MLKYFYHQKLIDFVNIFTFMKFEFWMLFIILLMAISWGPTGLSSWVFHVGTAGATGEIYVRQPLSPGFLHLLHVTRSLGFNCPLWRCWLKRQNCCCCLCHCGWWWGSGVVQQARPWLRGWLVFWGSGKNEIRGEELHLCKLSQESGMWSSICAAAHANRGVVRDAQTISTDPP